MGKDILSQYGADSARSRVKGAKCGGVTMKDKVDVNNWSEPSTPGYDRYGSMRPGIGGDNYGNCGTQGPKSSMAETSGEAGLRGRNKGMGTNRKG